MVKIFLAEDDPTLKGLMKTLLEIEGYHVATVGHSSLSEILEQISRFQPDLILLDVHLRQTNGFDILNSVHKDPQIPHPKVLMTSGEDLSSACIQNGADGFLLKPYMPDELLTWIRLHISDSK